jgi:transketolase
MQQLKLGRPNLDVFAETLLSLAEQDPNILVVTGDSRGSAKLLSFAEKLPQQLVEVGIAEQNLIGISAGLASSGKKVFAVSPASFSTARALEQIKNDIAYSDNPVKLVGVSAGVSYGALGSTHHSTHDFAVLQAIHNIDIVAPADNYETRQAIQAAVNYPKPLYLRFGKRAVYDLHDPAAGFEVGRAIPLASGHDITFIGTGETVAIACMARELLEAQGFSCGVISMHTLKPFDKEAVLEAGRHSKALVTVEEHSIHGGLGSLCAALLMQAGVFVPIRIVGIPDEETITGSQPEILSHYGISPQGLADTGVELLQQRRGRP